MSAFNIAVHTSGKATGIVQPTAAAVTPFVTSEVSLMRIGCVRQELGVGSKTKKDANADDKFFSFGPFRVILNETA